MDGQSAHSLGAKMEKDPSKETIENRKIAMELAREMAQNCLTTHYKNCNFKPPISSKSRPSIKKIQKPVKKTVDKEVLTHESQIGELE